MPSTPKTVGQRPQFLCRQNTNKPDGVPLPALENDMHKDKK